MPLTGTYNRTIDDKHRLAVPKPLRDAFSRSESNSKVHPDEKTDDKKDAASALYVAPGTDTSLVVFSESGFQSYSDRFSQASVNRKEIRQYLRIFYSQAERIEVDSQGRIRIPDRLITFAKLSKEAVMLGVHDHAEVWDKELWESFLQQHGDDFDEVAAQSFE
ncbi:cell division protein [bacterium]|nr:cell division protein [bacterium]